MRQLGQQYGGNGLVGTKLFLLRCDQQSAAAAAADGDMQLGVDLWMPAEVTAFDDSSGEHEVRHNSSMLRQCTLLAMRSNQTC
jgi:hypothetical protein